MSGAGRGRFPVSSDEELWREDLFDPAAAFGRRAPLEVEVGSGKARFLIEAARRNPAHDFLGLELSLAYYRTCRDRVAREGASNLRVVRADGRRFVERALARGSVRAFHVYFPDPWPKKKAAQASAPRRDRTRSSRLAARDRRDPAHRDRPPRLRRGDRAAPRHRRRSRAPRLELAPRAPRPPTTSSSTAPRGVRSSGSCCAAEATANTGGDKPRPDNPRGDCDAAASRCDGRA
jgi:hypothetical protein